jgi:hypothetical protein
MPITRAPLSLAIWPTTAPVAAATVLPRLGLTDVEQANVGGESGHPWKA